MNKEWLDNLKPGDEVAVNSLCRGLYISKVKRITKTLIVLESEVQVTKKHGTDRGQYPSVHIEPPTPALRDKIRRSVLISKLQQIKWSRLPIQVLDQIFALIAQD